MRLRWEHEWRQRAANVVLCLLLLALPVALHWREMWSGRILSAVDTPQAYFPLRWLVYTTLRGGAAPWWNQYVIGGMPLAAQPDAQALYVPGWLWWFVMPPAAAFNLTLMLHYGLAGMFTFLLLRQMKLHAAAAACGGLSFMWCGFLAGHRVHAAMVETAVWLPGVLWALAGWLETRRRGWLLLIAGVSALQLLGGYMQIVLMTWGMAGLLLWVWLIAAWREWRAVLVAALALVAGALLASFHVLNVMELAQQCTRATLSYEQFSGGAFPPRELWRALFPFLNGAQWHVSKYTGVPYYRGVENYAELAFYAGAAITIAASAAWWHGRARRLVVFGGIAAFVALVLMAGPQTPVWRVLYHVPLLNKFRMPARYLLMLQMALAMLGAAGLDVVFDQTAQRWRRAGVLAWMGVVLGLVAWLVYAGRVPNANLATAWVRVPLWCAAGVWMCAWLSVLPAWWGRVAAWLPVLIIGYEMTRYGYNSISSNVADLLDRAACPPAVRTYHERFGARRPLPRVFNCFRNYFAKDRGIGPNRNILMGVPTVDAYGPLYLKPFAWLGHDPSGFYTTVDELVRDNDVVSMLNVAGIAEYDGGATATPRTERMITNSVPVPLPPLYAWRGSEQYVQRDGSMVLTGAPAIIYTHMALRRNTAYRMTIDASAREATDALRVDLCAETYDTDAQEMAVSPLMLEPRVQRFQHVIETGEHIPAQVLLRVFTFSSAAIHVTNVQLEELDGPVQTVQPAAHYRSLAHGLWENGAACPRAWFVERVEPAASRWAALDWIAASPVVFEPRREALVEGIAAAEPMAFARIITNAASANARLWEVENPEGVDAFLVISEVWYPGWRVELNEQPAEYYRVNGLIGGVRVPPGRHTVVVKFRPAQTLAGCVLALAGVALLLGVTRGKTEARA